MSNWSVYLSPLIVALCMVMVRPIRWWLAVGLVSNALLNVFAFDQQQPLLQPAFDFVQSFSKGQLSMLRETFENNTLAVTPDARALVLGMTIGDDSSLSDGLKSSMQYLSLTHLTAVSGANCAIVSGLIWFGLSFLRMKPIWRTVLSIALVWAYVLLVEVQGSVVRAATMATIALMVVGLGRKLNPRSLLFTAMAILLSLQPALILDLGFQLSAIATFGLIELAPKLYKKFSQRLPRWVAASLSVSIAAQLFCLPLLASLNPSLSLYCLPANLVCEVLVAPITVIGLLGCLCAPWFPWMCALLTWVASLPAFLVAKCAQIFAAAPKFEIPGFELYGLWVGLGLLVAILLWVSGSQLAARTAGVSLGLFICIALLQTGVAITHQSVWPEKNWTVVSCDVGQGDATVVRDSGQIAVIDVGREASKIDRCLSRLGINQINLLVLTHYDLDHVGGLAGVLRGRKVNQVLETSFHDTRPGAFYTERELQSSLANITKAEVGMSGNLGQMKWRVLSPHRDAPEAEDSNDGSVTMIWRAKRFNLLTLADLGEKGQMRLVSEWDPALTGFQLGEARHEQPLILKVAHHGSADQYAEFIEALHPEVSLVSVGKGNPYGHPTQRTLGLLSTAGSKIFRTDLEGFLSVAVEPGETDDWALRVDASGAS